MTKIPFRERLSTKIIALLLIVVLLSVGSIIVVVAIQGLDMIKDSSGLEAESAAKIVTAVVDSDKLDELNTSKDKESTTYKNLSNRLLNIKEMTGISNLYIVTKESDNSYSYILDSNEKFNIGDDFNSSSDEYLEVFNGKTIISEDFIKTDEGTLISAYIPIVNSGNEVTSFVGVEYNMSNLYNEFSSFRTSIIYISLIIVLLVIVAGGYISHIISKPIKLISEQANKIANYEYNINDLDLKQNGEMKLLADSFNKLVNNNRMLILNIKNTTQNLQTNLDVLLKSTDSINYSSKDIAQSVNEIAVGATDQANETNSSLDRTNNLANKLEDMSTNVENIINDTNILKTKNEKIINTMLNLRGQLNESSNDNEKVNVSINDLLEKSTHISNITDTINHIAEQTNMLALNASIEAARAGENGKGFSVVANEVKILSDQSAKAVYEIQEVIQAILNSIEETNNTIVKSKKASDDSVLYLNSTKDVFIDVKNYTDGVINQIQSLHNDIDYIEKIKEEVLNSIKTISVVAEEAAASTEEVSATSSQQSYTLSEIADSINNLHQLSNNLNESIKLFKL